MDAEVFFILNSCEAGKCVSNIAILIVILIVERSVGRNVKEGALRCAEEIGLPKVLVSVRKEKKEGRRESKEELFIYPGGLPIVYMTHRVSMKF